MLLRCLELKQIGTDDLRRDAVAWETGKIEDPRKLIQMYAARKSKICRIPRYQDGKTGKDRTLTRSRRSDLLIFALRIHPPETDHPIELLAHTARQTWGIHELVRSQLEEIVLDMIGDSLYQRVWIADIWNREAPLLFVRPAPPYVFTPRQYSPVWDSAPIPNSR